MEWELFNEHNMIGNNQIHLLSNLFSLTLQTLGKPVAVLQKLSGNVSSSPNTKMHLHSKQRKHHISVQLSLEEIIKTLIWSVNPLIYALTYLRLSTPVISGFQENSRNFLLKISTFSCSLKQILH